jgi:hypothetical protein
LRGGGFTREESRFVIEALNVYAKDIEQIEQDRQSVLREAGRMARPAQVAGLKDLEEKQAKLLESMRKDLTQMRGGALKSKLEALLFLMKRGIQSSPSQCQERLGRLLAFTAMTETAEGKVTSLGLTVSSAWGGHQVQAKTVLKGPVEGLAANLGVWGRESAAVAFLEANANGLYSGESEHYESCEGSNLTKLAGSTHQTRYREPAARAALK